MGTARRFVHDEAGMTLALAMIMIIIIGAMGAGLLTFVNRDLVTVVEENRGQRAFEVADAGIQAAKRQLASNVDRAIYNGNGAGGCGIDDTQWSALRCGTPLGLSMNNLDRLGTTSDSAHVIIYYRSATDDFRVVSTGTYGDPPRQSKRRIEAIFKGVEAGAGGGETIGHPVYYTKTNIKITQDNVANNPVSLNQVSLFTLQDILIPDKPDSPPYRVRNAAEFVTDMTDSQGSIDRQGGSDKMCDWNSKTPLRGCFEDGTQGNWNTISRTIQTPGMGAAGKICSYAYTTTTSTCGTSASIADGVYGFDSTTTPRFVVKDCQINNLPTCPDNASGTISPPFPLPKPIPTGLKAASCQPPATAAACQKTPPPLSYFVGNPTSSTWGLDNSNASNTRVAFIDAQNQTLTFQPSENRLKGIMVVWCGRLELNQDFEGIILNLVGNNLPGNTSCDPNTATTKNGVLDGKSVGTFENKGYRCQCWVYAEGGTSTVAGIQLDPDSIVQFRPSQDWSFEDGLFQSAPPTNFKLQSWRELYQASP